MPHFPMSKLFQNSSSFLLYWIICLVLFIQGTVQGRRLTARREPNNVQCFKNSDCLSDCCISNNGWVGVCVGKPQIGQICGLFTTANSGAGGGGGAAAAGAGNPWSWSYGGIYNGMIMNGGQSAASAPVQQPAPSARPANTANGGSWVTDLNALMTTNPSGSPGRDPYDASGLLHAFQHTGGGAGGGMDYNGANNGNAYGAHRNNGGFNVNNFDLASLKYGNKFGKRTSDSRVYGY